ncbi:MAG: hypothetical protein ACRDTM_06585 [Micromonosporaceae bacterium]
MQHTGVAADQVEFRISTRDYVTTNLLTFLGFVVFYALFMLAFGWVTDLIVGYPRPVDFWDLGLLPGVMLLIGTPLVLLMAWVMARKRRYTVLSPYGVDYPPQAVGGRRGLVPWPAVVGVGVIRVGFLNLIGVRLANNTVIRVAPPHALRREDPRLTSALASFREHAQRYGGRVDVPVRSGLAIFATVVLVVFGLLALVGLVRLATAPIIPPWAPQATALPDACEAVERAGLDKHWPAAQREPLESETPEAYDGQRRECDASAASDTEPVFDSLTVGIERHVGRTFASGAKQAYEEVAGEPRVHDGATPVEIGDLGYRWADEESVAVAVCRGDVVVTVELHGERLDPDAAAPVAEQLAAAILNQIPFD